ncbi:MAG: hypothetical protein H8F28_03715 [Fibrella sp.]|nr:hypothetical protein [Armatimonadota bacterium]
MPRGRPRIHPTDEPAKPLRGRKPPAPPIYDSLAETRTLIGAILRSRGDLGASPEMLQRVVAWARSVRTETNLLHELAERQRRPKTGTEPDRAQDNEMNRALLDGVLGGSIVIRVADDGGFTFASLETMSGFREISTGEITGENAEEGVG